MDHDADADRHERPPPHHFQNPWLRLWRNEQGWRRLPRRRGDRPGGGSGRVRAKVVPPAGAGIDRCTAVSTPDME